MTKMFDDILPRSFSDIMSCTIMIIAISIMFLFEMFVVVLEVNKIQWHLYIHGILGFFILYNIFGNLYKVMVTDTSTSGIVLPSLLKPLWQFCSACEANGPPRSFHCHKCRSCILKRDHHCVFACCCIGLKNFRYYLAFLFHLSVGSLYATALNMFFIWKVLGGVSTFSILAHFVPFIYWISGHLDTLNAFYTLLSMLSISGFLFVVNLFILHTRQTLKNQTSHERIRGYTYYDLGWKQNLIQSLGTRWYLVLLSPSITSTLPGDGLSFLTKRKFEKQSSKNK